MQVPGFRRILKMMRKTTFCLLFFVAGIPPAQASSPDAWAELDKASAAACIAASGFKEARVEPSVHFSDDIGFDVRVVSGVYPQAHMKGATGKMLCLYGRATKRVEVQELVP
jgi:hypothetical protein